MKDIDKNNEFTFINDGFWAGTKDKDGKIRISPKLHYRSIDKFDENGIARACQEIKKGEAFRWGLIDTDGNHVSEFIYDFVEPWGEGYYKCEKGVRKNLLRPDGSEVLDEWFHDVYMVYNGFFEIGNTIRKSKTNPKTRYMRGLAHVNGSIIFPPIFECVRWIDDVKKNALYAELEGKPYVLLTDGGIYDPERAHLPVLQEKDTTDIDTTYIEKFVNWVLPGMQLFYRDTDAPIDVDSAYHVGDVIRAGFFVDATTKLLKPIHKTRFLIASAHAARFFENESFCNANPNVKKWNLCVFHMNSFFKVMDIYKKNGCTQVFLLHIPESSIKAFGNNPTAFTFVNQAGGEEQTLIDTARASLDCKLIMEVHERSFDENLVKRMAQPIGLDGDFHPVALDAVAIPENGKLATFSAMVHRMAEDDDITIETKPETKADNTPKDNFPWNGPKHTVCDGCMYAKGIPQDASGCGRLFKKSFRENVVKGKCQFRKTDLYTPSEFEKKKTEEREQAKIKEAKSTDVYAVNLLKDFIKDKLNGDISNLRDFDFSQLQDDEKYGNCGGYSFSVEKSAIMKAIMSLAFSEAWPEVSYAGFEQYHYEVAVVNTFFMLFGFPYGETFKGLDFYRPTPEMLERVWAFYKQYYTLGNYLVWPSKIGCFELTREKVRRNQRYIDAYLQEIYLAFINDKRRNVDVLSIVNDRKNRKKNLLLVYERTTEGFATMCDNLLLGHYLGADGKPLSLFDSVWVSPPRVFQDEYLAAVEKYLDFCEKEIAYRSEAMIKRLKVALGLEGDVIEKDATLKIEIPKDYKVLKALPDDPDGAVSYAKETEMALCFAQVYPIKIRELMPMHDDKPIIDGIHECLADNQGIIEVHHGKTRYDKNYVYSIVKNLRESHGITYILTMHFEKQDQAVCIRGNFDERGITGIKEAQVFEYCRRKGKVKLDHDNGVIGWCEDPYDPCFKRGVLMNLSEDRWYDNSYPKHPLTQLRRLIAQIIDIN